MADVTSYTYDSTKGYRTSAVYPNGGTVSYTAYDANHNVLTMNDQNGIATTYTYDYAGRVLTISTGGAVTAYEYDFNGNIKVVKTAAGTADENRFDYTYDALNRVTRITDGLGNYISYVYDPATGNRSREEYRDSSGSLRKYLDFEYDQSNRLTKINNPDSTYTQYSYNAAGDRTAMIAGGSSASRTTGYAYDALRRLTAVTQAQGTADQGVTAYSYDAESNLVTVTDAKGGLTTYSYDDFGRLVKSISPDTGTTEYGYDGAGNLITKTDANDVTVAYEYDAMNRLIKIDYPGETETDTQNIV